MGLSSEAEFYYQTIGINLRLDAELIVITILPPENLHSYHFSDMACLQELWKETPFLISILLRTKYGESKWINKIFYSCRVTIIASGHEKKGQ